MIHHVARAAVVNQAARALRFARLFTIHLVLAVYAVLAPFGYAAFALLHLWPARDPARRARMLQWVLHRAFRLLHDTMRVLRLVAFNPRCDVEGSIPAGPCVLVANHPSLIDVTAIMATLRHVSTAVKPSIYRRFWLRPLLAGSGQFEGSSPDHLAATELVAAAMTRLRQGFHVLLFPEGTRSPRGSIGAFGRAAFEVACRAGLPIVPIVIHYEPRWLSKERGLLDPPDRLPRMRLKILPPEYPTDSARASRALRNVIEQRFRRELGLPCRN